MTTWKQYEVTTIETIRRKYRVQAQSPEQARRIVNTIIDRVIDDLNGMNDDLIDENDGIVEITMIDGFEEIEDGVRYHGVREA